MQLPVALQDEGGEEGGGAEEEEEEVEIDWGDLSHSHSTDSATGQQSGVEPAEHVVETGQWDGVGTGHWDGVETREREGGVEVIEWDEVETVNVGQIMIEESGEGERRGEHEVEVGAATNEKTEPGE